MQNMFMYTCTNQFDANTCSCAVFCSFDPTIREAEPQGGFEIQFSSVEHTADLKTQL